MSSLHSTKLTLVIEFFFLNHFKKSWNIEENGGKQCWEKVGHHPHPGTVGQLQRPVDDRSVNEIC